MNRTLKALGVTLVAVFSWNAMVASTATAKTNGLFTAHNGGSAIIDGSAATSTHFITPGNTNITCTTENYIGPTISGQVSSLEFTPEYSGCKSSTRGVTVTHNECKFKFFNANDTIPPNTTPHEWRLTTSLVCPPMKKVEIHIYNDTNHASGTWCTLTYFQVDNENLEGLTATVSTNTPSSPNDIELHGSLTLRAEFHGTCSAGLTIKANGTLAMTGITLTGTNHLGEGTSIHIG